MARDKDDLNQVLDALETYDPPAYEVPAYEVPAQVLAAQGYYCENYYWIVQSVSVLVLTFLTVGPLLIVRLGVHKFFKVQDTTPWYHQLRWVFFYGFLVGTFVLLDSIFSLSCRLVSFISQG